MYKLKTLLRTRVRSTQQGIKRLSEKGCIDEATSSSLDLSPRMSGEHYNGPVSPGFEGSQYSVLEMKGTVLKLGKLDNCVQLKNGHIVLITNLLQSLSGISSCGHYFTTLSDLYLRPIPSSQLMIFAAKGLSGVLAVWSVNDIQHKCVCLPNAVNCYAIFPLLHTCNGTLL